MKRLSLTLAALVLAGCSGVPVSVGADAATTAVGLSQGLVEANPLGWATVPLRLAAIEHSKSMPEGEGAELRASVDAFSWGAAASNIALIATGATPVGIVAGMVVGLASWQASEKEREFYRFCEQVKTSQERCVYESVRARPD